jgi:hypothetical protein
MNNLEVVNGNKSNRLLKNGDRHQFRSCKFMIAGNELTRNWVAGPLFSTQLTRAGAGHHPNVACVLTEHQGNPPTCRRPTELLVVCVSMEVL